MVFQSSVASPRQCCLLKIVTETKHNAEAMRFLDGSNVYPKNTTTKFPSHMVSDNDDKL